MQSSQSFSGATLRTEPTLFKAFKPPSISEKAEKTRDKPAAAIGPQVPNLEPDIAAPVHNRDPINPLADITGFDPHSLPNNFMALLVASRRSGKSVLTEYLLKELQKQKRFTHVFLVSPSDAGFKPDIPKKYRSKDVKAIRWIMNKQIEVADYNRKQEKAKTRVKQRICIVCDDAGHLDELHKNQDLKELAMVGRHIGHPTSDPQDGNGISVFVLTQSLTAVSPKVRRNMDIVFINNIASAKELDTCCDEAGFYSNAGARNKHEARDMFHELVRGEPYRFLAIENHIANKNHIADYVRTVDADIDYKHKRLFGTADDDRED